MESAALKKREEELDGRKKIFIFHLLTTKTPVNLKPNEIYLLQTLSGLYRKKLLDASDDNELTQLQLLIKKYKLSPKTKTSDFLDYKLFFSQLVNQVSSMTLEQQNEYNKIREDEAELNEQKDAPVTSEDSGILGNTRDIITATSNSTTVAQGVRQSRNTTLKELIKKNNEQNATKAAAVEEQARQDDASAETKKSRDDAAAAAEKAREKAREDAAAAAAEAEKERQEAQQAEVNIDQYIKALIIFFYTYVLNLSSTTVDPSLQQKIQNIESNIKNYINIISNKNYFTIGNMEKINSTRPKTKNDQLKWSAFLNIIKSLIRWCNFTFLQMMYNELRTTQQFQDIIVSFLNFTIKSWIYDIEGFTYDNKSFTYDYYISTYYNELVTSNDFITATEKFLTDVKSTPKKNKRIGRTVIIYEGRECDTNCRINSWAIPDGKGSNFFKLMTDKAAAKQIDEDRTLSKWGKSSSLSSGTKSVQRLFGLRGGRKTRRQRRTKQRKYKVKGQKKTRKQRRKKTQKRRSKK